MPAYLQGREGERPSLSPGTQASSMSPACPLPAPPAQVALSEIPKDTCAQGPSPATAQMQDQVRSLGGSGLRCSGRVSVATQTPEDPGHPRLTPHGPAHSSPQAHLIPGLGSTPKSEPAPGPACVRGLPWPQSRKPQAPAPSLPSQVFPLGPRPPWAHLSMPVRAPAHLHRCPSAPESPAPA